jgi:acyl-CoA reductase-like NAD-dependent aldehyde dehydrogenase
MLNLPVLRWGKPYESLEKEEIVHFLTGEPVAAMNLAGSGIVARDLRQARRARDRLRDFSCEQLIEMCGKAGESYLNGALPIGDGTQTPDDFVKAQSATTGLPEHMCRANMKKNHFVLANMREMLDALTRGLDLSILSQGYGRESRGVTVSYQAQTPVLGAVLPSNSPGVHTLWLPAIAMQIGLALKPGSQEPWTPYRMQAAMVEAGIPAEAIALYPGAGAEIGGAILNNCGRSMIFGGPDTIARYQGNPGVQVHGPGYSKILLGDDVVDRWPEYLDLICDSVFANGGRSCINASGVWASRHTKEIAAAVAERLGPVEVKPPDDAEAALAAFTVPGAAEAVWNMIESNLNDGSTTHATADYGPRFVEKERCGYLRPVVVHCGSPEAPLANKEFMFPFVGVVECPQEEMLRRVGPTLVCTAITDDAKWRRQLTDATHIDRLNVGPIPTHQVDWLQPHEGNLVEFLFRSRAYQSVE